MGILEEFAVPVVPELVEGVEGLIRLLQKKALIFA